MNDTKPQPNIIKTNLFPSVRIELDFSNSLPLLLELLRFMPPWVKIYDRVKRNAFTKGLMTMLSSS